MNGLSIAKRSNVDSINTISKNDIIIIFFCIKHGLKQGVILISLVIFHIIFIMSELRDSYIKKYCDRRLSMHKLIGLYKKILRSQTFHAQVDRIV